LLAIIHEKAKTAMRYALIDRLELGSPLKKIEAFLQDEHGKTAIESERPILGVWTVFQYLTTLVADEKTEYKDQVWVNMLTNEVDPIMKQKQHHIMYQQQAPYAYPFTAEIDMEQALQTAT